MQKKGGRRRKEQREYTERIILTTCEMQKPKTYSYLALHDGAIEKMLHHGTPATNTELKAEQGFDERFTQCALYGSSVHARSVPEQGFDELQTTSTELKAEQGFDELRRTTSKAHHQRMLYTPHCQTLVLPVTVNILQRRRLSGRLFEKLCHSPAETFGSQGS